MRDEKSEEHALGSFAEEAAKLLNAVSHDLSGHVDSDARECDWCPACRSIRFVRDLSPEVKDHLEAAASSLALAATSFLSTATAPPPETPGEHFDMTDEQLDE